MNDKLKQTASTAPVAASDLMSDLINRQLNLTDRAKVEVENAVRTLAQRCLEESVVYSDDALGTIKAMIAEIDQKLTEQVNLILHHEKLRKLEGSWRGLKYLVDNSETDAMLKIRVMNISKKDLANTLKRYRGAAWDQSPIFNKIYEQEYGTPGGHPYGCLIGDYEFDQGQQDVDLLREMSQVAAAAHAPFIAAASPGLLGMKSWQELSNPRDIKELFDAPDYAAWRSLRETEDSRYLGLVMPRFLARTPYGAKTNPVDAFEFEEATAGGDSESYVWANAAYAMAANINRSYSNYGWCTCIRGVQNGGAVQALPQHTFPSDDGGVDVKCPTEIAITNRREKELADCGLMPLVHYKNTDMAIFIGAQSLQKPTEYDSPEATANARLSANLPYLFASSRFSHYLNKMVVDWIGNFTSRDDMQRKLQKWINQYVLANPEDAGPEDRAQKPLAKAEVVVSEIEGNPGFYAATFSLRPHYQLEGVKITMSLVSKVPSERKPA
jgi:type VI secretion system protein ImpC